MTLSRTADGSQLRFTPQEFITAGITLTVFAVSITLWSVSTFQTKAAAADIEVRVDKRFDSQKMRLDSIQNSLNGVATDVAYIRGRMEKQK